MTLARCLTLAAAVMAGTSPAHADGLGISGPADVRPTVRDEAAETQALLGAIARHDDLDVTALRSQVAAFPDQVAARCTLGVVHARRNDLPRAMVNLADCADATLPDDLAREVRRATLDVKKRLRASQLSQLTIVTNPAGLPVALDALDGERLITPVTVWVKAGAHTVRTTSEVKVHATVTVAPYARAGIVLEATPATKPTATTGRVDFSEDNAVEQTSGPPPDIERPSLLSDKYRGVTGPRHGPLLDDPLAGGGRAAARPWFGVRLGGGVFDDGDTGSSWRPSLALASRFSLGAPWFVAARLDWSRRGGAGGSAIDTAGASVGAGATVLGRSLGALAVFGQLRGDLRFADTRDMQPVRRAGAAFAAGVEFAMRGAPLTIGLRVEQGLTELTRGTRDRAALVELGVDWR